MVSSKCKNKRIQCNTIIDGNIFFNQLVENSMKVYDNVQKIATGQENDHTFGYLLVYNYFKEYYDMTAIDLSKQQALDADPEAMQLINFTGNLDRAAGATMFFIIEEAK